MTDETHHHLMLPDNYWKITQAETDADVEPVNFYFPPGDMRRYGAVADDSTDCASAIEAAVAQMNSGGSGVYFPPGTYRTSQPIRPITQGWLIYGDDWRSTRINWTTAVDGVVMAAEYGRIAGLWLHGQSVGKTGLIAYKSNSCVVDRVYCHSWTLDGMRAQEGYGSPSGNTNSVKLIDCFFNLNTGCGLRFVEPTATNDQNAWDIVGCSFSNNTSHGILLRGFSHKIIGGIIDANGGYGIQMGEDGDTGSTVTNLVLRPYIENHTTAGVYGSAKSLKNWVVLDNLNANSNYSGHASAEDFVESVSNSSGPYKNSGLPERYLRTQSVLSGTTRVQILAEGSDTNIPFYLFGKGTGGTWLEAFNDTTNGLIKFGQGGTGLRKYLSATATLNFDLTSVASQDLTVTVTGAQDGDSVALGVPNASVTADTMFWAWVSATNTVTVRAMRTTGTPNPASGTFRVSVFRH